MKLTCPRCKEAFEWDERNNSAADGFCMTSVCSRECEVGFTKRDRLAKNKKVKDKK
jgi:hypothetical protein